MKIFYKIKIEYLNYIYKKPLRSASHERSELTPARSDGEKEFHTSSLVDVSLIGAPSKAN